MEMRQIAGLAIVLMMVAGSAAAQVDCTGGCTTTKYGLGNTPDFRSDKVPPENFQFDFPHEFFGSDEEGVSYFVARGSPNTADFISCGPERNFSPLPGQVILREQTDCNNPTSEGPRCVGGTNPGASCFLGTLPTGAVECLGGGTCEEGPGTSCRVELVSSDGGITPVEDASEVLIFTRSNGLLFGATWRLSAQTGNTLGGTSRSDAAANCPVDNYRLRPTMGTRYLLPVARGGDGTKTYVRWDNGGGLFNPTGCDRNQTDPQAANFCARTALATNFRIHTDDSAVCCNSANPTVCGIVNPGTPNYPLILSRTCQDVKRYVNDDNIVPDWVFMGNQGTRFWTDPDFVLPGEQFGVCETSRFIPCSAPGAYTAAKCAAANSPWPCCTGAGTGSCAAPASCTALGAPFPCCTGPGTGNCGSECTGLGETCDFREFGPRVQVRGDRIIGANANHGNPRNDVCGASAYRLRGRPIDGCSVLPRLAVNGDPGPDCGVSNYGIDHRDDTNCNGTADVLNDTCFFTSEWNQSIDRDGDCSDPNTCRGDECECGDQNDDGNVTVSDLVQINNAIFGSVTTKRLCDGNNDLVCTVSDIVAGNNEIFTPGSSACRQVASSLCHDGLLGPGEFCDDGTRECTAGTNKFGACLSDGDCPGAPAGSCQRSRRCVGGPTPGVACVVSNPDCGSGGTGGLCQPSTAVGGDGCNTVCRVEEGWTCTGEPSVCTR
jgi:hypothetical protein